MRNTTTEQAGAWFAVFETLKQVRPDFLKDGNTGQAAACNAIRILAAGQPVTPATARRRVYISGPMSGYPGHNFAAFNDAASQLRAMGYEVVNPVDINPDPGTPWAECLKADLRALLDCTDVACLTGWELSRGAKLEVDMAMALCIPCRPINTFHKAGA